MSEGVQCPSFARPVVYRCPSTLLRILRGQSPLCPPPGCAPSPPAPPSSPHSLLGPRGGRALSSQDEDTAPLLKAWQGLQTSLEKAAADVCAAPFTYLSPLSTHTRFRMDSLAID